MKSILLVALLAFGLVVSVARAGEWSIDDPVGCDEETYITLYEDYLAKCVEGPRPDCALASGCMELHRIRRSLRDCVTAADHVNNQCLGGMSSPIAAKKMRALAAIQVCTARISLPEPIGCGRICP